MKIGGLEVRLNDHTNVVAISDQNSRTQPLLKRHQNQEPHTDLLTRKYEIKTEANSPLIKELSSQLRLIQKDKSSTPINQPSNDGQNNEYENEYQQ